MSYTLWFFTDENPEDNPEFVREGEFESVADAEDCIHNIGSKWFFYPHALITDSTGAEVVTYFSEP